MRNDWSNEQKFIVQVLNSCSEAETGELISRSSNLKWSDVLTIVREHRVEVAFLNALTALGISHRLPDEILEDLKSSKRALTAHSLKFVQELGSLLDAFDAAHVPVIPLKGPFLAEYLYSDPLERAFSDLDLLVRQEDVDSAVKILRTHGFGREIGWEGNTRAVQMRFQHSQEFLSPCRRVAVDLHWALLQQVYAVRVPCDEIWNRVTEQKLSGRTCSMLSPEDLLIFLCVHGGKHHWSQLRWIRDIDRFFSIPRKVEWKTVLERSSRWGVSRMLLVGSGLASRLFGSNIPTEIDEAINQSSFARQLIEEYLSQLFNTQQHSLLVTCRKDLQLRERARDKFRYVRGRVFFPHAADLEWIPLPDHLFPLYYIVHPVRHVVKSFQGAFQLVRGSSH